MSINLSKFSLCKLRNMVDNVDDIIDSFMNFPYYICGIIEKKRFNDVMDLFTAMFEFEPGISVGKKIDLLLNDESYYSWNWDGNGVQMRLMMLAMLREYIAAEIESREKRNANRREYRRIANDAQKVLEYISDKIERFPTCEWFVCPTFFGDAFVSKVVFQDFFEVGYGENYTFGAKFGWVCPSARQIRKLNKFRLLALAMFIEYYRSLAK